MCLRPVFLSSSYPNQRESGRGSVGRDRTSSIKCGPRPAGVDTAHCPARAKSAQLSLGELLKLNVALAAGCGPPRHTAQPLRANYSPLIQAGPPGEPGQFKLKLTKARSSTLNDVLC